MRGRSDSTVFDSFFHFCFLTMEQLFERCSLSFFFVSIVIVFLMLLLPICMIKVPF